MEEEDQEMFCNNCGKKMKKRAIKTIAGSWDTWDCPFCHE